MTGASIEMERRITALETELRQGVKQDISEIKQNLRKLSEHVPQINERLTRIETLLSENGIKARVKNNEKQIRALNERADWLERKVIRILAAAGTAWVVFQTFLLMLRSGIIHF